MLCCECSYFNKLLFPCLLDFLMRTYVVVNLFFIRASTCCKSPVLFHQPGHWGSKREVDMHSPNNVVL